MTELQLRSFRAHVAAPSPSVREVARSELLATVRGERPSPRLPVVTFRRATLALAGAAVVAVGALALAGVVGRGPGVIERAQAAIDPRGRILHVVVRIESGDGSVTRGESWVRADGSGRSVERSGSRPTDCLAGETELRCYDPAANVVDVYRYYPEAVEAGKRNADLPGFRVDRPASIHRAFGAGYAHLVGRAEIDGRPVYEIRLAVPFVDASGKATPRFDDATGPILYLDRGTYFPVAETFPDAGSTTHYETYEFLPDTAGTRRLLELPTRPGARVVVHPVGEGPRG